MVPTKDLEVEVVVVVAGGISILADFHDSCVKSMVHPISNRAYFEFFVPIRVSQEIAEKLKQDYSKKYRV